jgi:hypothetical protein
MAYVGGRFPVRGLLYPGCVVEVVAVGKNEKGVGVSFYRKKWKDLGPLSFTIGADKTEDWEIVND